MKTLEVKASISMEGLDSVHLWAKGKLATVLLGAKGLAQPIKSAHMFRPQLTSP